jgi:hypothetical protein
VNHEGPPGSGWVLGGSHTNTRRSLLTRKISLGQMRCTNLSDQYR